MDHESAIKHHYYYYYYIACVKEINCFWIFFPCWFVDLLQIPRNEFACKLQGTLFCKWVKKWWYGLIMHFCDSNHEITRSNKRKYDNIKDHYLIIQWWKNIKNKKFHISQLKNLGYRLLCIQKSSHHFLQTLCPLRDTGKSVGQGGQKKSWGQWKLIKNKKTLPIIRPVTRSAGGLVYLGKILPLLGKMCWIQFLGPSQ